MSPRKRSRAPKGLVWRVGRAYFDRRHSRFNGGRLAISLRTGDRDVATERHTVLTQLMDRGDWNVLEAIRRGDMHITDAQAALRNGDATKLRRMGSDSPRLGPAIERFLRLKEATRSRATVTQYRMILKNFEAVCGPDLAMETLTADEARTYLHAPKENTGGHPWAPATQELARVVLAALWAMVMAEEVEHLAYRNVQPAIRSNPWKGIDMPEIRPTRAVFLTPPEWVDLDRSMVGVPSRAMIAIAFLAGLRQGEILHLRTDVDVLLESPEPLIRVQSRNDAHSWRPKTRRGERDVPITESLVAIIEDHIRRGYAGERYLMVSPHRGDRPVTAGTSARWTQDAFELAGIKYGREGDGLTLHSGRHTYASWLAQDGVPLNVIATLLGDTTKVVEETYAHLIPDTYRSAVQCIERRMQG